MYSKIIKNDIKKSKLTTIITVVFIAVAATLVSLASILAINLSSSIDNLMEQSQAPHFMQMHSGDLHEKEIASFAQNNGNVKEYQVIEFINVDNSQLIINGTALTDTVQDNGIVTQSEKFDYLLDMDNNIIQAQEGEIYLPITHLQNGLANIGDTVSIYGKTFVIGGFLRDSQMNPVLAESKRLLLNSKDFAELKDLGTKEYLIEFLLNDASKTTEFETAYANAGLDANGPTITLGVIKLMNGLSDGILLAVIILISILITLVSFVCIRFTLLAKIEEDYREIGVMKAIGLRNRDVQNIYLSKYAFISFIGCLLGLGASLFFKGILLQNIRLYMGERGQGILELLVSLLGMLAIFIVNIIGVNLMLRRFRKISAAEAIRFNGPQEKVKMNKYFNLSSTILSSNLFIGIKDIFLRKKLYITMLIMFICSAFILIVPFNIYNTISSRNFITYMGMGEHDLRVDIQQLDNIAEVTEEIATKLASDPDISKYTVLTTKVFKMKTIDGNEENLKIELGNHQMFPISYIDGKTAETENEISISTVYAEDLALKVGSELTIVVDGMERIFTVSGIYSDVTNGGKTAKANFTNNNKEIMWSIISAELYNNDIIDVKANEYTSLYPFTKVSKIDDYIKQLFGGLIGALWFTIIISIIVVMVMVILITVLFFKMLFVKDRKDISILKAIGFNFTDIKIQYQVRGICVLLLGIIIGTILSNTIGESFGGMIISAFGAVGMKFNMNIGVTFIAYPMLLIVLTLIGTYIGTQKISNINISENIK